MAPRLRGMDWWTSVAIVEEADPSFWWEWLPGWLALALSLAALVLTYLGWNSNRIRVAKLEALSAVDLEIVPLPARTWLDGGQPTYGVRNNGTETEVAVQIDMSSVAGVGLGGNTMFSIERGEVAEHFWFKALDRADIPLTVRFIWDQPHVGSQHVSVPLHPAFETGTAGEEQRSPM